MPNDVPVLESNATNVALQRTQKITHTIAPDLHYRDVFVVANRTMFSINVNSQTGEIRLDRPTAGGLVTATANVPMTRVIGWPGANLGNSDQQTLETAEKILQQVKTVPVHLTEAEYQAHYLNFANQVLWLLFHADSASLSQALQDRAGWQAGKDDTFLKEFALRYDAINGKNHHFQTVWQTRDKVFRDSSVTREVIERFASVIENELIKTKLEPIVWIHDYQLIFLSNLIRERLQNSAALQNKNIPIGFFCHIPFPKPIELRKAVANGLNKQDLKDILLGPLGADQIGFHIQQYCDNFLDALIEFNLELDLKITRFNKQEGWIEYNRRIVSIKAFPIGIEYATYTSPAEAQQRGMVANKIVLTEKQQKQLAEFELFHQDTITILSVERLDPIKGIVEKLRAFEVLLARYPELLDKVSYECIVVPSRTGARINDELDVEIKEIVLRINGRFKTTKFPQGPVNFVNESRETPVLCEYYRRSHIMNAASSADGMNLTAMEYVAARQPGTGGALILSVLMGVTEHLSAHQGAPYFLMANPDGALEEYAAILFAAVNRCNTPAGRQDMNVLKEIVVQHCNVHAWASNYLNGTAQMAKYNRHVLANHNFTSLSSLVSSAPMTESASQTDIHPQERLILNSKSSSFINAPQQKSTAGNFHPTLLKASL